jgi:hypothetical protein
MPTPYKFLSDEQQQIIRERNLKYYHDNKEKINKRTKIYWKEYYKKHQQEMLERQKKYHIIKNYFRGVETNYKKLKEKVVIYNEDEIAVNFME